MKKPVVVVEDAKLSLSRLFSLVAEDYGGGRLHLGDTRLQHGARCREWGRLRTADPSAVFRSRPDDLAIPSGLSASACTLKPAQE